MTNMFEPLNPELIEIEQQERVAWMRARQRHREQLAIIGYVPPARRARSLAAAWLLSLAVRLDARIAEAATEPAPLRPV